MKVQIALALFLIGAIAYCQGQDVSRLLMDRVYVNKQINCILERGPCDGIGRHLKDMLPQALDNNCQRCTPAQKRRAVKLISFMRQNYPNEWNIIVQRYSRYPSYQG
ncbi:hypothetical protein KPH14_008739 [Odynerus spinipes]|uniref:Uncharacterized protein n=1 Tax=Odynerus spinipes TaxID=1348599 RepID=A0AAD9R8C9_9HYME|nr:hypothetical protein KPH14_008739 [Odynerus spinipes]